MSRIILKSKHGEFTSQMLRDMAFNFARILSQAEPAYVFERGKPKEIGDVLKITENDIRALEKTCLVMREMIEKMEK